MDVTTPNLDKMLEVQPESQAIGEFLEWLSTVKGYTLGENRDDLTAWYPCMDIDCENGKSIRMGETHTGCGGTGGSEEPIGPKYVPAMYQVEELLAEYFEVDLAEAEREKRAILEGLR